MDVHLRELRSFVAVAERLHFTQAADALYVSQPALSKQIRALEARLRVRLFARNRRGVVLTTAGEALLPEARAVLAGWERAEAALAAVQRDDATLLVGMSTGLGRGLLPSIHARVAAALPDTRLRVRQVDWGDPTGGLAADDADRTDAAFVWLPLPDGDRLAWLHVATEPRLVALPATHPLARGDSLHFGALLDEPFLALPISSGALRDHWLAVEARGGRPALIGAEVRSAEETVEALRAGLGVCLVASGNAELIDRDGVVLRPVHGLAPSTLVLAWRRGDDRPAVRALRVATEQVVSGEFPATPVPKGPQGAVEPTAAR